MTDSSMNDFNIEKVLGKGSFGSVYLVRRKEDNKIYALKSVILEKLNKKEQQNSVNEVRILASVNHPNVIGYKEAFWDDSQNTLNIVMEYADDGDLQTKIIKMRKEGGMFQENLIWSYSIQMIEGLKALHDKKIMHRDLKSANIFLVKDKHQCKLGDMNVSKVIKEKELLTQTGTPYYASPEVWRDEPYSYKSDLWSIGCVIYELCALRPPFKGKDLDELFLNVCKGKPERISRVYSDDLWKMILMLLKVDVKKRCDCDMFLNSKLITRKIQEMKKQNKEYKNLEKNMEINDGDLLDTIKFENIMDIKRQLPTKKNYGNNNDDEDQDKINKNKDKDNKSNISNDEQNNNSNNIKEPNNSLKYRKINNKSKKLYNSNKLKTVGKNKPSIKTEIEKGKKYEKLRDDELIKLYMDLESDSQNKISSLNPKEYENSVPNISQKIHSSLKNPQKNKYFRNSPDSKVSQNEKNMIYQKPKLFENSIKRDKKVLCLNKPMTTKRTTKKINYLPRDITPKKESKKNINKTEIISSMDHKPFYPIKKKNMYKKNFTSINRERNQNLLSRPNDSSPFQNYYTNINNSNNGLYLNNIKKQNYSKKLTNDFNQRPLSVTPSNKNDQIKNNLNKENLLDKNYTEINLDIENENNTYNNNLDNYKEYTSNRETMIKMLNKNSNKKVINFDSYNINNSYNIERPLTTTNNSKKNKISQALDVIPYELKNPKKIINYPYNKIKSREKQSINNKRNVNKKLIDRDMTEPELLKMMNPIKLNDSKKEYQRTANISLNSPEQNNTFLRQQKGNKMIRFNTNNDPRYNQYYLNNTNQNNPQIFNNFVSINNLVTPNFPVKLLDVFGQ